MDIKQYKWKLEGMDVPFIEDNPTETTEDDFKFGIEDDFGVVYSKDRNRLLKGSEKIATYSIKKGTKVICDCAFWWSESLQQITIPDSVMYIGDKAFFNCSSLQQITIPNSVLVIGAGAFDNCTSLQQITIPDTVEYLDLGVGAFHNCKSLQQIIISDSVRRIGELAFLGCDSLQKIIIPDGSAEKFKEMIPEILWDKLYCLKKIE